MGGNFLNADKMKKSTNMLPALFKCTFPLLLLVIFCDKGQAQREQLLLDKGWKFYQGDIAFPVIKGHSQSYENAKAGKAWGAAAPEYNDNSWRSVTLPHDWAVEGGFDPNENISQGYRKRGIGWYRRSFKLDSADKGKHLELQFDGIATHATVWFNGTLVHRNWCGYTSSYIDISSMAKYGEETNTISIRVDANAMEGWWYEGAGIYRHTWLVKRNPVHITTDGVYAHPVKNNAGSWQIPVEVTVENIGKSSAVIEVESSLIDKNNKLISKKSFSLVVDELKTGKSNFSINVSNPELWSVENPALYKVVTILKKDGKVTDEVTTKCGFRTLRFTADSGFYLNDKQVKLQGVCNHQDHAGVGVAVPEALWEFRLRKLKEMGVNAYRCSHNPPAKEFLEACDSLGILVMDENRNFNASPEYIRQLEWMIKRDRNHPSIILWSVFNEEPMQGTEQGYEMVRRMSAVVKSYDSTRPVTAAMNGGLFASSNVSKAVDVVGFNYQIWAYDDFKKANPGMLLTSSEDGSAFQVRGEYVSSKSKHIAGSYDTESAEWGATHRKAWKAIAERPYLAGGFYWTGFDYRGEPTPFKWPSASSFFGIMDLCGFPKAAYWLHQAQWRKDIPVLQLVPHWNWPADSIGKNIKVMCFSNADSVMLMLNGKKMGGQKVDTYEMNTWQVPFYPGKLEAIGYKNGKEIARSKTETTGNAVTLQLIPDRNYIHGDGVDAMPITVKALDEKGREVPTANFMVDFSVNEKAAIIGLGNGDPNSHEPEKGNKRSLFNGLAQLIIQSNEGVEGVAEITATAIGMKPAVITIPIRKTSSKPYVPVLLSAIDLTNWRISPFGKTKPDARVTISENDMNSWMPVKPGELVTISDGIFVLYNTNFNLNGIAGKSKGRITFRQVVGKAEVWLNDTLVATKLESGVQDLVLPFDSSNGNYKLTVMIEGEKGKQAGLGGVVAVLPQDAK